METTSIRLGALTFTPPDTTTTTTTKPPRRRPPKPRTQTQNTGSGDPTPSGTMQNGPSAESTAFIRLGGATFTPPDTTKALRRHAPKRAQANAAVSGGVMLSGAASTSQSSGNVPGQHKLPRPRAPKSNTVGGQPPASENLASTKKSRALRSAAAPGSQAVKMEGSIQQANDTPTPQANGTPTPQANGVPTPQANNATTSQANSAPTPQVNGIPTPQAPAPSTSQSADPTTPAAPKPKRKKPVKSRAEKAAAQEAHYHLVLSAARKVVEVLAEHGLRSAVFGSLACKLYGAARYPKDVDLLVLQPPPEDSTPPLSAADIKSLILRTSSRHFFLTLPRDPTAPYRILHYRATYPGPTCKVDILTPGIMDLPQLPLTDIKLADGVPLVPFPVLLAHKLQGWSDHVNAEEAHKRGKTGQDVGDLKRLFGITVEVKKMAVMREEAEQGEVGGSVWGRREWFSEEFEVLTRRRVRAFCMAYPDRRGEWRALGFDTSPLAEEEKKDGNDGKASGGNEGVRAEQDEDEGEDEGEDLEDD